MPDLATVQQVLLDDGVGFVATDGSFDGGTPAAPVIIPSESLPGLITRAADKNGQLGRDLDALAGPVPTRLPPAALLAGYVRGAKTPGADLARVLLAGADLTHPEDVVFPTLVLELFLADSVHFVGGWRAAPTATPPAASPSLLPSASPAAEAATRIRLASVTSAAFSPCQEFADIVYGSINKVFDALHIPPGHVGKTGSEFLDAVLQGLTDVVVAGLNLVINGVRSLVINGVKVLFGDLIDVIAQISSVVALVGTVLLNIEPLSLRLAPDSNEVAKDVAPVLDGLSLTATVPFASWPPQLDDCARLSTGKPLPSLKPIGSTVTWTTSAINGTDLGALDGSQDTTLRDAAGDDTIAAAILQTGVETPEQAQGAPAKGAVRVDVTVDPASYRAIMDALTSAAASLPGTALHLPEPLRSYLSGLLTQATQEATIGPHEAALAIREHARRGRLSRTLAADTRTDGQRPWRHVARPVVQWQVRAERDLHAHAR